MKDIKFRVWDLKDNIICSVYYLEFTAGEWWAHCLPHTLDNTRRILNVNQNPLMQYIGLKDCKRTKKYPEGQEIYENDKVLAKESIYHGEVLGIVQYDDKNACFVVVDNVTEDKFTFHALTEIEVISIYENPELMR